MKVVTRLAQCCSSMCSGMEMQTRAPPPPSPYPLQTQVTLRVWNTPSDRTIPIDKKSLNNFGDAELSPLCQIIRHSIQATFI